MTASVLVTGALHRCEEKKSGAGKMFVIGALKVFSENASEFWNFVCFSDSAKAKLLRLAPGEKVSLQGALKVETYVKDGETRVSLKVIADHGLALTQPKESREKKEARQTSSSTSAPSSRARSFDGPNDDIPF